MSLGLKREKNIYPKFFFSASFPPKKTLCPKNVLKKKKMSEKRLCPQMFSHSFSLKVKISWKTKYFFHLLSNMNSFTKEKKENKSSL